MSAAQPKIVSTSRKLIASYLHIALLSKGRCWWSSSRSGHVASQSVQQGALTEQHSVACNATIYHNLYNPWSRFPSAGDCVGRDLVAWTLAPIECTLCLTKSQSTRFRGDLAVIVMHLATRGQGFRSLNYCWTFMDACYWLSLFVRSSQPAG